MTHPTTTGGRTTVSSVIKAPRKKIYQAFLDPKAVASWLAPDTMRSQVHTFDPREGGQFRISLMYQNPADSARGKTAGNIDTYHGRFVKLIPDEEIVEAIEFETQAPGFTGEMTMTVKLVDVEGGTDISLLYENVPPGIRQEDNEEGSRQSLKKLAAFVE
jgi:uncharacterized protein YndB with AHSA1/START domain